MTKFQMIKTFQIFFLVVIVSLPGSCLAVSIVDTKHNLSATGPGDVRALIEDKICVFCHTPHNATPFTPLWNKNIEGQTYTLYHSSTLSVVPGQPSGPTRLCLSCHDGMIALGEVVKPPKPLRPGDKIEMITDKLSSGMRSYLGTDISNDHPVAFSYYDALPNPELADTLPPILHTYGDGNIHCTTCHDPHDNSFGKFLVMNNTYSALCITCHDNKTGWDGSAHAISTKQWRPSSEDPLQSVAEYGCESCHIPHGAGGPKRLLRFLKEEENCYPCHEGPEAATNIKAQITKPSSHRVADTTIGGGNYHDPAESVSFLQGHVECVDCHNPHAANDREAEPPAASGSLAGVKGIDESGAVVNPLTNQYELCFKCHGNSGNTPSVIERWIDQNDTTLEFNTINPSYHPVTAMGKNSEPTDVPSLPSAYEPLLNVNSIISCVDCHDSDESSAIGNNGPRGPHGSIYTPILRQRYGVSYTADIQFESESVYALCYRCHDRSKFLNDSASSSFLHKKHVVDQHTPCFICHDPHGVQADGNGDHTHLINFAKGMDMVSAVGGNPAPYFIDGGSRTGSCVLVCHGRTHDSDNKAPATYGGSSLFTELPITPQPKLNKVEPKLNFQPGK